jgi:HEAT repeat protein
MHAADASMRRAVAVALFNLETKTMAKLKTAILRAQETADITGSNEALLWQARAALSDALYNMGEPDEGLTSAERALHLINTYLLETELCK